ncbi:tetratricopeptide repeat protein [Massilia sp. Dwa41.01b]|uniref:tetratricopeptide repeat protein n=1 Tax=Massilia sp. Dwa41.01b TaxID=2709302 RepID=UPI0016048B27|nr:tetratricopeptide repeat protein [Massilia sp. Dwa41.01b]QNA88892.1 tetratricopeptide repeat protein [Massilia sp. Dwa41.01b]
MSLINKMLQDLDARGKARSEEMPHEIQPVPRGGAPMPALRVAAIAAAVMVLAMGATAWYVLPLKGKTYDVQPLPPSQPVPQAPVTVAEVAPPAAPAAATEPVAADTAPAATASTGDTAAAPATTSKPPRTASAHRGAAKPAAGTRLPATPRAVTPAASGPALAGEGRIETSNQASENAYRRALGSLQDGRVSEAIAGLQAVLRNNPKHEAARQTLVGLLIEAKREDEAMVQLQQALTLDPRQPAMAMLLARLQIERGQPGIDTLLRTLPYASGKGEYHAFLGGALQRQGRYREAADQYQTALRSAPDNAVWWMGLGLALQAEKRNAEAADALRRASSLGTLNPELQAFVERKLAQVSPQ